MSEFIRRRNESGFAMMTVVMGVAAMVFLMILVYQQAASEYSNAQYQRRDDTIIAGAEAMLERYSAKLTIDPLYYRNYVDEAELARTCSDSTSPNMGLTVAPGNAWYDECQTWDYDTVGAYYQHPLLGGSGSVAADNIGALLTITPPVAGAKGIKLTVVAQQDEFGQLRSITAEVKPESISEFAFLVEDSLRFGSGAVVTGKIYVGNDLDFRLSPVQGIVHRDIYVEDKIGYYSPSYGPPVFQSGSEAYDGWGDYKDIREVYPDPLTFTNFWDDLDLVHDVACGGGGLCLSRTENPGLGLSQTPTAWLLQPSVLGGVGRVTVSAAYSNNSYSCVTSEEWWWVNSQSASWSPVGTFDIPPNGVIWVDGHLVMGLPGDVSTIKGAATILAGTAGSRKNIVLGSDLIYAQALSGTDVLGLIASDEIYVNPSSVGADNVLNIHGAFLAQGGTFNVARDCGAGGNPMLPYSGGVPISTLNFDGAMAIHYTGDVAAHFSPRNYDFDPRLETLRPPLYPLLQDAWYYDNWREEGLPCWALPAGCTA